MNIPIPPPPPSAHHWLQPNYPLVPQDNKKTINIHWIPVYHFVGYFFQYTLETFTESRSVMYKHVPYDSGAVDHPGKESGPPQAWDMDIPPPSLFEKSTRKVEIPKTSSIQVRIKCMECWLTFILCLVMCDHFFCIVKFPQWDIPGRSGFHDFWTILLLWRKSNSNLLLDRDALGDPASKHILD